MDFKNLAYVVGIALGDGNLSNPNGRATRLRITCDTKYPKLIKKICLSIQNILPDNKVSIINRAKTYIDIYCYSNRWEGWLGWKVGMGSKYDQRISVPVWIKENLDYSIECLRGLLQTDGSIYLDRGYKMVNFVTIVPKLAADVLKIMQKIGFNPHIYKITTKTHDRYNIRLSKDVDRFIKKVGLTKN